MSASPDRRVTPWRGDLAAEHLRGRVESERFATGTVHRVASGAAPIRVAPDPAAELASEALFGETFTVYESRDGWAWGQLASDGYVGYVPAHSLAPGGSVATHRVAALRTYLYAEPDLKAPTRALISMNAELAVERIVAGFAAVAAGGFVHAAHLTPVAEFAADFVAVAERFLGTPYLWGGRTSLGLDCSALVQLALAAAGIACPRDSDMIEQAVGEEIGVDAAPEGLARGDLLFWHGHVGVMRDPDTMLHASAHHMETVAEPVGEAARRIGDSAGPLRSVRRINVRRCR